MNKILLVFCVMLSFFAVFEESDGSMARRHRSSFSSSTSSAIVRIHLKERILVDTTPLRIRGQRDYERIMRSRDFLKCKSNIDLENSRLMPEQIDSILQRCNPRVITTLKLGQNGLLKVPAIVRHFADLRELDISDNLINSAQISSVLKYLLHLKILNIGGNYLTTLPEDIANLSKLKKLYIFNNTISDIPENFRTLTSLEELYMYQNNFGSDMEKFENSLRVLEALPKLKALHLGENKITILPDLIGNLSHLHTLYLNNNQISVVPNTLLRIHNLQFLFLERNLIKNLSNWHLSDMVNPAPFRLEVRMWGNLVPEEKRTEVIRNFTTIASFRF